MIDADLIDDGSYDPDGDPIMKSVIPETFTCINVGLNTVELTVEDDKGATNTCLANIMVRDTPHPFHRAIT